MRSVPSLRALALGAVVFGLTLLSSSIVARQFIQGQKLERSKGSNDRRQVAPALDGAITATDEKVDPRRPRIAVGEHAYVVQPIEPYRLMETMDLQVNVNMVSVAIGAKIHNMRPEARYMWGLQVFRSKDMAKVMDRQYRHQIFTPPLGEDSFPTFDEAVTLRPGEYKVVVQLYKFDDGFDLDSLRNRDVAELYSRGKMVQVTIGR